MFSRIPLFALLLVSVAPDAHAQAVTAIVSSTVIDVTGGPPIRDAVILVEGRSHPPGRTTRDHAGSRQRHGHGCP